MQKVQKKKLTKRKHRKRNFARCDERPPFRRRRTTNCPKSLIKTFLWRFIKVSIPAFTIKTATRGSLLSTGCFLALILNHTARISLWFTVSQTSLENIGSSHVQTLDQPPFKFFGSTFLERKVENKNSN